MGNINILNIIKIKNFCLSRDTVKWVKRQVTEWEKIFATYVADKRLTPGICTEYL